MKITSQGVSPLLYLSALAVVMTLTGCANMTGPDSERGVYAGAGYFNSTKLNPDRSGTNYTLIDDTDDGAQLELGYDWGGRLSTEIQYTDLGAAKLSPETDFSYKSTDINALFYLAGTQGEEGISARQGLNAYVKAGIGYLENEASGAAIAETDNATHLALGAGLEWGASNGWGLRAEFTSFDTDAQGASLGVVKRFGKRGLSTKYQVDETVVAEKSDASVESAMLVESSIEAVELVKMPVIYFGHNKADLSKTNLAELNDLAEILKASGRQLTITGHTDSKGSQKYNHRLGMKRAKASMQVLVDAGVDASQINVVSLGESQPVAENRSSEGRQLNRRINFELH